MSWTSHVPNVCHEFDLPGFAFASRVKALHHWIRKGDASRAANTARTLFHQVNVMRGKGVV